MAELRNWLILSFIAMILFSVATVILKNLLNSLGGGLSLESFRDLNSRQLLMVGGIAVLMLSGALSLVCAINLGKPALITAVVSLSTVVVALLSFFFLNEQFTIKEMLGMVLAVISILILAL